MLQMSLSLRWDPGVNNQGMLVLLALPLRDSVMHTLNLTAAHNQVIDLCCCCVWEFPKADNELCCIFGVSFPLSFICPLPEPYLG